MYKPGSLPTPRHLNKPKLLIVIDFLGPKEGVVSRLGGPGHINSLYSAYAYMHSYSHWHISPQPILQLFTSLVYRLFLGLPFSMVLL